MKSGARAAARAGAVLVLAAAGLVATATPSFAVSVATTLDKNHGPSGGGYSIILSTVSGTTWTAATGPNFTVQFNIAATCPTTKPSDAVLANTSDLVTA